MYTREIKIIIYNLHEEDPKSGDLSRLEADDYEYDFRTFYKDH